MGNMYTVSSASDSVEVFMKGGGCKESYTAFQDCIEKNKESLEKNKESLGTNCFAILRLCLKTHSEYYQPVFAAEEAAAEVLGKDLDDLFFPSAAGRDQTECEGDADVAEDIEKYNAYLEGSGCMESITAYVDCSKEAEMNKEDEDTKCAQQFSTLMKCLTPHPDYYHPVAILGESSQKYLWRELEKSL